MVCRGFRNLLRCELSKFLLAAVALQKIHWVDGNCVSTDVVVVVIHSILLKVFSKFTDGLSEISLYMVNDTRVITPDVVSRRVALL